MVWGSNKNSTLSFIKSVISSRVRLSLLVRISKIKKWRMTSLSVKLFDLYAL